MPGPQARRPGFVFKLPQFAEGPSSSRTCDLICLEDKRGRRSGVLRRIDDTAVNAGDLVELIAISTGVVNEKDAGGDQADKMYKQHMEPCAYDRQCVETLENRKPLKYDFGTPPYSTSDYLELTKEMEAYGTEGPCGREYHFYNVLWIERRGQIAYRRAAGRVPKEVWDAECSPPMKIILG